MKTIDELTAIDCQLGARIDYCVMRLHVECGNDKRAKQMQEELSLSYRFARAYMGVTNGDVKKAEQTQ